MFFSKVKVTKNCETNNDEQFIRYMKQGDWFGESALTKYVLNIEINYLICMLFLIFFNNQ